jgi:hypothetical protein
MDAIHVRELLERLGCKVYRGSPWIPASCPFAQWDHSGGTDKNPSFHVAADDTGHSGYKCKTCHAVGDLRQLLWRLSLKSGRDLSALASFVEQYDTISPEKVAKMMEKLPYEREEPKEIAGIVVHAELGRDGAGEEVELPALPESTLDAFRVIPDDVMAYLTKKRGLSLATIKTWELGWHPGARRISIPIRDLKGRLVAVSGRAFDPGVKPKFMHSKGFQRDYYLYGEHLCQTGGVGFLVEGFFDAIALWQRGYRNPLCFMGSGLSKFQVVKVVKLCERAVIVPDGDKPGYEIADRVYKALQPHLWKTIPAHVPEGKDPDELTEAELEEILGPPQVMS